MTSYYSIIQYRPDICTQEAINIGVVAYDETRVLIRRTTHWKRVKEFGGDTRSLKALLDEIETSLQSMSKDERPRVLEQADGAIVFSPPCVSTLPVHELATDAANRCLAIPNVRRTAVPGTARQKKKSTVRSAVRRALIESISKHKAKKRLHVETQKEVRGVRDTHKADITLSNGRTIAIVETLSFDLKNADIAERDLKLAAWLVDDVASEMSDGTKLAVCIARPSRRDNTLKQLYKHACTMLKDMKCQVVDEGDAKTFADELVGMCVRSQRRTP